MSNKNPIIRNIDKAFVDFLKSGDDDYVNSYLEENGENLYKLEERGNLLYKRISFLSKAKQQSKENEELLLKVAQKFKAAILKNQDKPIATLRQIIQNNPQAIRARNLDKLDEEDIKELIKGLNLVEILNTLKDQEDEPK
jgi:uncharacterized protein YaaW (UPF0174 family)